MEAILAIITHPATIAGTIAFILVYAVISWVASRVFRFLSTNTFVVANSELSDQAIRSIKQDDIVTFLPEPDKCFCGSKPVKIYSNGDHTIICLKCNRSSINTPWLEDAIFDWNTANRGRFNTTTAQAMHRLGINLRRLNAISDKNQHPVKSNGAAQ